MAQSNRPRLDAINKRLNELYIGLDKFGSTSTQGKSFQEEVDKLEQEKPLLSKDILKEEKITKYLRSTAGFIYLQEHTLKSFEGTSDEELTESERKIKQYAIEKLIRHNLSLKKLYITIHPILLLCGFLLDRMAIIRHNTVSLDYMKNRWSLWLSQ